MSSDNVRRMPLGTRLSYSVGHILNDLTASMWFSYLLIYFHQVKFFDNKLAGDLMLIGQVSDALFTPFIGFESDRTKGFCKMGKRKSWHFLGTLCVIASFPFLFTDCITCSHAPDWSQFIYFAPFVVIFQFGWASTQISHLSLIPELSDDMNERVELNGWRYACTVLSNLAVYGIAWLYFAFGGNDTAELNEKDAPKFRNLMFTVIGIGAVFTFIFHLGTRERPKALIRDLSHGKEVLESVSDDQSTFQKCVQLKTMKWSDWLKDHQFYQVGFMYMFTRLYVNLSQVYMPMYLVETLNLDKVTITIIPLVVFSSGFVTSLAMRPINMLVGRKVTFFIGIIFAAASCSWMYFIMPSTAIQVYGAAVFLGIGGSTMQVTSLVFTADLINKNSESGAFVYGAMSFNDKLSNGIAIEIIQQFHPCKKCCPACKPYYRYVESLVPGGCVVLAFVFLLTIIPFKIGERNAEDIKEITVPKRKTINYDSEDEQESLLNKFTSNGTAVIPDIINTPNINSEYHVIQNIS